MPFRTKEKLRSGELTVSGDEWPVFLYHGYTHDPNDPWNGLFHSSILIKVSTSTFLLLSNSPFISNIQAYKHIFTSPSSMEKEAKATRSRNARIHCMTCITIPSVAYVATQVCNLLLQFQSFDCYTLQVRFALSSSLVFSQTDLATNSERFYNSILDLFYDPDEQEEVTDLIVWWNR